MILFWFTLPSTSGVPFDRVWFIAEERGQASPPEGDATIVRHSRNSTAVMIAFVDIPGFNVPGTWSTGRAYLGFYHSPDRHFRSVKSHLSFRHDDKIVKDDRRQLDPCQRSTTLALTCFFESGRLTGYALFSIRSVSVSQG